MTSYRRGDVVLVDVEFTDRSGSKLRPAVVLSTLGYNQMGRDVVIVPITSNLNTPPHLGDHGTRLRVVITGEASGTWSAVRTSGGWELDAAGGAATATATLDQESAWRMWTKGLTPEAAAQAVQITGDRNLAAAVRRMVAFIG
ncbi:MAG TPA: hypothetical protein DEV93_02385 [Chloroflexi bacterium]|jgi:mRNA-degrading endonuclease toxin of MazEF toxin-antitoxin module|nr:hypothetical protein [Chloroflexota bacterium]